MKQSDVYDGPSASKVNSEKLFNHVFELSRDSGYQPCYHEDSEDPDDLGTYQGETYCRFYLYMEKNDLDEEEEEEEEEEVLSDHEDNRE